MTTRFNELVLSFEHFANATNYPNILCNVITAKGSDDITLKVSTFLSALKTRFNTYDSLQRVFANITTSEINTVTQDHLQSWLFKNSNTGEYTYISTYLPKTYCKHVATIFSAVLEPIKETSTYDSYMKDVSSIILKVLYGQINGYYCKDNSSSGSACGDLKNNLSLPNFDTYVEKMVRRIKEKQFNYLQQEDTDEPCSLSQYLDNIFKDIYRIRDSSWTHSHCNLFAICFRPFFCYLYLTSFLPTFQINAGNQAPRNGRMRNHAILAIYKFIMYFLYGTYKLIASFDPSLADALLIRQAIDTNVLSLYNTQIAKFKAEMDSHDDKIQQTISSFSNLDQTNREIVMARVNATNIATNEIGVSEARTRANILKILWVVITLLYAIAFIAVYALSYFKKIQLVLDIFMGTSVALFAIICVVTLVKIV
jgi:hypothetical protein